MTVRRIRRALAIAYCMAALPPLMMSQWQQVAPGVRVRPITLTGKSQANRKIDATAVECDPRRLTIRVLDVYRAIGSASSSSTYSLNEVFSKVNPIVAINAGPTDSFTLPVPVGLLITDGQLRSPINKRAPRDSAFVCFSRNGNVRIDWAFNFSLFECRDGVQAAPLLLPSASIPDFKSKDEDGDLADNLKNGVLSAIQAAMCLDGAASSGLIVNPGNGHPPIRAGTTTSLIASAIVVETHSHH